MVEYTEFLGFSITMNGNTYVTKDLQLPNARVMQAPSPGGRYGRGVQMIPTVVVHKIEWQLPLATSGDGSDIKVQTQLTRNPQTAMLQLDNKDLIAKAEAEIDFATAVGFQRDCSPSLTQQEFTPPIVVPEVAISVGAIASGANTNTIYGRIHYTIRWMEATQSLAATVR